MKRIAFYLENKSLKSVDCSKILRGNPGIGGTQYMIMVVSYLLSIRDNDLSVKVFAQSDGVFPDDYNYAVVKDFIEAVNAAYIEGYECLIFRHDANLITSGILEQISYDIKLIVWDHVFVCHWELDYYAKNRHIYRIVNVGREMMDLYRDHEAFNKSLYIYNCLYLDGIREKVYEYPFGKRRNIVVYMGSLVRYKGFHILAEAWPKILKSVPDAELYVIGTGRLYDKNLKLGDFGIAEEDYEKSFMKYLTVNGTIMPSVHFMGDMGIEKNDILLHAKVGVPNPSGITETFCISAVEMQACGAMVATIKFPGFMDTVKNGILYKDCSELAETVVKILRLKNSEYDNAMNFFEENFSFDSVAEKWENLLYCGNVNNDHQISNKFYRLKWLKEFRRRISKYFPFLYKLSPIERFVIYIERRIYGRFTYIDS